MRWPRLEWWHYAGLAGLGVLAYWKGPEVIEVAADYITRGRRLTVSPPLNGDGQVPTPAEQLLAEAEAELGRPIGMDAYALARMVRTEGGEAPPAEKQARAWVAVNDRAAHPSWDLLHTVAGPDRLFGRQAGWRYATGRNGVDPYENDLAVAEGVLSGALPDNTGGALKFVDLAKHDATALEGQGPGSYDPDLLQSWGGDGLVPDMVADARPTFRVFRRA